MPEWSSAPHYALVAVWRRLIGRAKTRLWRGHSAGPRGFELARAHTWVSVIHAKQQGRAQNRDDLLNVHGTIASWHAPSNGAEQPLGHNAGHSTTQACAEYSARPPAIIMPPVTMPLTMRSVRLIVMVLAA